MDAAVSWMESQGRPPANVPSEWGTFRRSTRHPAMGPSEAWWRGQQWNLRTHRRKRL